jgi:hypothetical protein
VLFDALTAAMAANPSTSQLSLLGARAPTSHAHELDEPWRDDTYAAADGDVTGVVPRDLEVRDPDGAVSKLAVMVKIRDDQGLANGASRCGSTGRGSACSDHWGTTRPWPSSRHLRRERTPCTR